MKTSVGIEIKRRETGVGGSVWLRESCVAVGCDSGMELETEEVWLLRYQSKFI